jgi:hypothetical protein
MIDTGNPSTWKTNHEQAMEKLKLADDVEWDRRDFELADRLRSQAEDLLRDPNHVEVPF